MKICTKCKVEKALECFSKSKSGKNGFDSQCKECRKAQHKKWALKNQKHLKSYISSYRKNNAEKIKQKVAENYLKNKDIRKKQSKEYYAKNKEIWDRSYKKNRENILKNRNNNFKNKMTNDPNFRLFETYRQRTRRAITENRTVKITKTLDLLGTSVAFARKWIESQFLPGMTWENHGKWHIDHIKPCASFDLCDPEQQRECFNYKNLQPLWAADNLRKSDRF